jgi:F-type H+-transporting ATPase subunit delta
MLNPRLAGRYAKSILDLAIERGELETVYKDMLWLQSLCGVSRDFVTVLRSPVIKPDKKQKILDAVIGDKVSVITAGFARLLIAKGREKFLPEIITSFVAQYKQHKDIHIIKLTTAAPVDEAVKNAIVEQVKKSSGMKNIELEVAVDSSLIGGFVLQAGDKLIDASISYDLKAIARQFENNDFVYKLR